MADINKFAVIGGGKKTPLELLQTKYVLSFIGGKMYILLSTEIDDVQAGLPEAQVHYYEFKVAKVMMERTLESSSIACSKPQAVIKEFLSNPSTTTYNSQAFSPVPQPSDCLNLWSGHTAVPKQGDWKVIDDYLFDVICSQNNELYKYILNTLAHNIQHPEIKTGICIVYVGEEGVGKGIKAQLLEATWGKTTLLVQDMDTVVGNFNKSIEQVFNVFLDEALFSGNKKQTDKLKSMITEPTITIEGKYEPQRKMLSYHRFWAATNRPHFAHIRTDDRRFLFVRVSNIHKQDTTYFAKVVNALHDGHTLEAFVHDLLNADLSNFDFRKKPNTEETWEQKRRSLSGVSRYWFEVLSTGNFTTTKNQYERDHLWHEASFITGEDLLQRYKNHDRNSERYESVQISTVYQDILKMCPSAYRHKKDKRGVAYPHIDIAREEFEEFVNYKGIPW